MSPRLDEALVALRAAAPDLEIAQDAHAKAHASRDESLATEGFVHAVLFPRSTPEVSEILRIAQEHRVPVVPRGAGTGLSGGAVPLELSWVVSLERMTRILEIDVANHVARVEPGVITATLRKEAAEHGLDYPPFPSSLDWCTLGGNVATNAGGLCAAKYGVTRKYVLGLTAVLPGGQVLHTGGKYVKHTSGYELTQLLTGSEGTLAILTEITLALIPAPTERTTLLVPFSSSKAAGTCIAEILSKGIVPPTLELMPKPAIDCVLRVNPDLTFPFTDHAATLLLENDGHSATALAEETEVLYEILSRHMAAEPLLAASSAQRDSFWAVRKRIREAIAREGDFIEADAVVPRQQLPALIDAALATGDAFGIPVVSYGHAGDGNLHTYFHTKETTQYDRILEHFFDQVVSMGGTISGEHGIGALKRPHLARAQSESQRQIQQGIKVAFDPLGILNPRKVV